MDSYFTRYSLRVKRSLREGSLGEMRSEVNSGDTRVSVRKE